MRLGRIAAPREESFVQAKAMGLEFLEFCEDVNRDHEAFLKDIPTLQKASKETGVSVGSVGRWGADKFDAQGQVIEEELNICKRLIDAAQELESPVFITGTNEVPGISYYQNVTNAIHFFEELIAYAQPRGVQIATYNCRWANFVHSDPAWTLIHGHLNNLMIKYDTSHCIYAGGDYLEETKKWGSRFAHVHIKGAMRVGGERFDDPPAGMDETNWGAFLAALYAVGYNGNLSIEPHSQTWRGNLGEKGLAFTIQYLRQFI